MSYMHVIPIVIIMDRLVVVAERSIGLDVGGVHPRLFSLSSLCLSLSRLHRDAVWSMYCILV